LCDRIALIQNGQFLTINAPKNIVKQFGKTLWTVQSDNMSKLLTDLRAVKEIKSCFAFGDSHHVTIWNSQFTIHSLSEYLENLGHKDIEISEIEPSIEDCFMELSSTEVRR